MATKKATKKTTSTARKSAPARSRTTVRTVKASDVPSRSVASGTGNSTARKLDNNLVNIVLAELVGTFVLTTVALMTASDVVPLYVGLTLAVLVMTIGAVSGSHVNPAVTFGLWASQRLRTVLVPFYWVAQLLGAIAAVVVMTSVSNSKLNIDFFGHFNEFSWSVFFVELIGTAIFLWGLTSVISRLDLSASAKAFGIGLSLFVALVASTSLYNNARTQAIANYQTAASESADAKNQPKIPHVIYAGGATLNPAVAVAATEVPESQLRSSQAEKDEKKFSRIGWEVLGGTLVGAALGANLSRLLGYRFRG